MNVNNDVQQSTRESTHSKLNKYYREKNSRQKKLKSRLILSGECISPGIAHGRAFIYTDILTRDLKINNIKKSDIDDEMGRIHTAMDQVLDDLDEQKNLVEQQAGQFNSAIFDFHKEVLKDKEVSIDLAEELESELINAEIVVKNIFRKLAKKLRSSDNSTFSSKADDLDDLTRRILRILVGYESNILEMLPPDSIIIAKRLLPSDTVHMKRESLKGIVVEEGSEHSHSALLARAFGLTAIANVNNALSQIHNGDELLLDGKNGTIIINPTEEDLHKFEDKKSVLSIRSSDLVTKRDEPARTKCGKSIKICANAYSEQDFRLAQESGCDGIGLFRLEQLYMSFKQLPSEESIFKKLDQIFKHIPNKEITIRLLDIGGDKSLPYLNLKKERNPFLGLRGIRFLFKHKDILKTQIKAILRLSELYPIRFLVPMVTLCDEIKEIKSVINECKEELEKRLNKTFPDFPIGVMIETPAAVFSISEIAEHVDFLSIGTNDLTQYIMAAGRENADVRQYYEKGSDLIMNVIETIVSTAVRNKIDVNICGEIAGDLTKTNQLLNTGIRSFSVSPYIIPELKDKIASIELANTL